MNIEKCRTCSNYDYFFSGCKLYTIESYLDEGDFDYHYCNIKEIEETECDYKARNNEQ